MKRLKGVKYIKFFDIVFFLLFALAIFLAFWNVFSCGSESPVLVVNAPDGEYVYPLEKDMRFEVQGAIGVTTIVVDNGEAFIADSPCKNKDCVFAGKIQSNGDWVACLPNRIILYRESGAYNFDAVSK